MPIYSHSRLSTFEQCPLKFRYKYIEFITPEFEETIESFLGKQVHNVLEWIYSNPERSRLNLDSIIHNFIENWNRNFNPRIKIVKATMIAEDYFNKGIKFLINYFTSNAPFEDNTIATEKKIQFSLDSNGKYQLVGYIDRLVYNPETNIFEIHDYKTGNSMKSQKELDNDRQLALYSLAIRELYEEVKDVKLIWHFLEYNKKMVSTRTLEQLKQLKQEIMQLINKIELTTDFHPNPGCLCGWCEYQTYCPYFENTSNKEKCNNIDVNNSH